MTEATPTNRAARTVSTPNVDALERAAQRLVHRLSNEAQETDEHVLRQEVDAVARSVQAARDGCPPAPPKLGASDRLGLVRRLRSALLQEWSGNDGELLLVMRSFDTVEGGLIDWSKRVSAPDLLTPWSRRLLREVAHMLRSPLGSMLMLADALKDGSSGPLNELQRRRLDVIHRAALAAATFAGDLLSLVSDEERVRPSRFSLAESVSAVSDVVRPVTEARSCGLDVYATDGRVRMGPAAEVSHVLLSLCLRTALMTRSGAVEIRATEEEEDLVSFSLTTGGLGAPAEEAVADEFRILSLKPESDTFAVSCDGLAIIAARESLRAMGSDLHLEATPSGAMRMTFRIALPLAE